MAFPIQEFFFSSPFHETVSSFRPLREYRFRPYFDDEEYSMYEVCIRQIPREICNDLIQKLRIGRMYQIGLVWQEQLFGIVGVFMPPEHELEDKQVFESFVRQASIAIARRQTEDRLRRSERRFRDIMNFSPVPAVLIESDGRYASVNEKFTETFGYSLQDVPNGKTWFIRAFPDPAHREEAVAAWKSDLADARTGPIQPRPFTVRCKSGEDKSVLCKPVVLSEGAQYVSYEDCSVSR
jgi:PAS domain S-box-containing protein